MWQWDDRRAAVLEMKCWVEWRVVIKKSEGEGEEGDGLCKPGRV